MQFVLVPLTCLQRRFEYVKICFNSGLQICTSSQGGSSSMSNHVKKWTPEMLKWNVLGLLSSSLPRRHGGHSSLLICIAEQILCVTWKFGQRAVLQPISRWQFKSVTSPLFLTHKKVLPLPQTPLAGIPACAQMESVHWCEYSHLHLLNNRRLSAQVHPCSRAFSPFFQC